MIKSQLIQRVAGANPHLFHRDVERIINIVLDEITGALARGDRVELARFDGYWDKKPAWDKVTFRMMSNDPARTAALLTG